MEGNQVLINKNSLINLFRFFVVGVAWFMVSIKPESSSGFYQTVFVASLTSLFEYAVIFLDSDQKLRKWIATFGIIGTIIYMIGAFLGLGGLIILDVKNYVFSFATKMPFSSPESIQWKYIYAAWGMYLFPALVIIEAIIKKFSVEVPTVNTDT